MAYYGAKRAAQGMGEAASPFIGEAEGAVVGSAASSVAGAAVGAGTLAAGVATANPLMMAQGAGMLGKEAINLPGKLLEWTEALLKSKEAIGQFNQAIASAQATAELRGVQRAFQSGQRTGGAYSNLSDAYQDFQDTVQPVKDAAFNLIARDLANGVRVLSVIATAVDGIMRLMPGAESKEEEEKRLLQEAMPFQETVAGIKAGGFRTRDETGKITDTDLVGGHSGAGMGGLPAGWGREPPGGRAGGHFDKPARAPLQTPEQLKEQWEKEDQRIAAGRIMQRTERAVRRPQQNNDAQVDFDNETRRLEASQKKQDEERQSRRINQGIELEREANERHGGVGDQGPHGHDPNLVDPEGQMPDAQSRMPGIARDRPRGQPLPLVHGQQVENDPPQIPWLARQAIRHAAGAGGQGGLKVVADLIVDGMNRALRGLPTDTRPPDQTAGNVP
jgi:hypothetical protein